jgi:hypothetical protein
MRCSRPTFPPLPLGVQWSPGSREPR